MHFLIYYYSIDFYFLVGFLLTSFLSKKQLYYPGFEAHFVFSISMSGGAVALCPGVRSQRSQSIGVLCPIINIINRGAVSQGNN